MLNFGYGTNPPIEWLRHRASSTTPPTRIRLPGHSLRLRQGNDGSARADALETVMDPQGERARHARSPDRSTAG